MFSRSRITYEGLKINQRCVTLDVAIEKGQRLDGVPISLMVIRAKNRGDIVLTEVMVPVVDQLVDVHSTGCTEEHTRNSQETRVTIGSCPSDKAARCAGCILNLEKGEEYLDSLRPFELGIQRGVLG